MKSNYDHSKTMSRKTTKIRSSQRNTPHSAALLARSNNCKCSDVNLNTRQSNVWTEITLSPMFVIRINNKEQQLSPLRLGRNMIQCLWL